MNQDSDSRKTLIKFGKFKSFIDEWTRLSDQQIKASKLYNVYDDVAYGGNICGYGFANYIILKKETVFLHSQIAVILSIYLSYIIGVEHASFAHLMRQKELNPSEESSCIWVLAEDTISEEERYEFAKEILSKWPYNEIAQQIIDNYKDNLLPQISVAEKIAHAIALDKKAAFKDLILRGRYIETRQILPMLSDSEIEALIFEIAEREHNVCSYDYVWVWMREKGETAQRHSFLAKVTSEAFKYDQKTYWEDLPGTKELIFFHTYRAAELEPNNLELQEQLLRLYEPTNESFDFEETKTLVERVLKMNPQSEQGLRVQKLLFNLS